MIRLNDNAGFPEIFFIIAALILGYMVIRWEVSTETSILLSADVGLFTATAAARLSAEASRREHTMTMLLHARTDQTLRGHVEKAYKTFGHAPVTATDISDSQKVDGVEAAIQILNFFELLAKAIRV